MPGQLLDLTWPHDPAAHAPPKHRRACRYHPFVPDTLSSLTLTLGADLAGAVSGAQQALHALNARGAALAPLARLLLRTESIASSRIEGMDIGVRALARAEARWEAGVPAGPSAREILANIDAMVLAIDEASRVDRFGMHEITSIHARLLEPGPQKTIAGRIRTRQNWIGGNEYTPCGAAFVPPPPPEVPRLLDDLCEAINDDTLPPLVQAALVHAQFETIHPFDDGNGRTGRALIQVVLRKRGVAPDYLPPISVVLASAREHYIQGLTRFRGDDVNAWIEQFAIATARSAHLAQSYLDAALASGERWRAMLASHPAAPRAGAAAWALIDVLVAHPIISAPVATAVTGRAKAAVYQAIEQLQSAGVLIPLTRGARNQAWEVEGMLALIERVESGTLDVR
ncbi:MAG: hypothetical protein JWO05_3900 [Gemmatimonadetes bacterium]|nr:hypothetical protein [Gemmatimonadota bacterium]